MSAETQSSLAALKRLVDGYRVSQTISAAVSLGVPDLLGAEGGRERTQDEFADLFSASGFHLRDAIAAGGHFVIEGDPV